jgi:hypothetical protein
MDVKRVTFTVILDSDGYTCEPPRPEGDEPRPVDRTAFLEGLTAEDEEIMRANPLFAHALLEPGAVEQYDLTTKSFQIEVEGTDAQIAGFICATFIRYGSQGLIHQDQDYIVSIMESCWHFDRDLQDIVDSGRYIIRIPRAEDYGVELTTNNLEEFLSGMHMYPRDLYIDTDGGHTDPLRAIIFDCNNVEERMSFLNQGYDDDADLQEVPKPDLKAPKIVVRKPRGG